MTARLPRPVMETAAVEAAVWPPILAVDPGTMWTGICLRVGTEALEACTVDHPDRDETDYLFATDYAAAVLTAAGAMVQRHEHALLAMAKDRGLDRVIVRRAVECMVAPTGTRAKGRRVSVAPSVLESLPVACTVLGAVVARWPRVIRVPPRGGESKPHGWDGLPAEAYPGTLRGNPPPEWVKSPPKQREHQRAAWAIAGVAHALDEASQRPLAEQVEAVVRTVLAAPPERTAEAVLAAIRSAIRTTGSEALLGREAAVAAAAARGLGANPQALRQAVQALLDENQLG